MTDDKIDRTGEVSGQYSKAVAYGSLVFLAGLIPENWDLDMKGQAKEIFAQIDDLLQKSGSHRSRLLSLQVFIQSFEDYGEFKEAYAQWVDTENLPARATVRAELLDPRIKVEIMAVAARA
ncbi:MAG: RidA family protein [Gimesia chilikensis]|uniref:RidA family protein n=1 Tax=Pseudohaliea sp. TaxID=2740289 RepID=UPI0032EF5116